MNGRKLEMLRKNNKITQKDFCNLFNIAQPTLSLWENGEREPKANVIKDIANYYKVSIDFLMDNEESIKENDIYKLERILTKEEKEKLIIILKTLFEEKYNKIKDTK